MSDKPAVILSLTHEEAWELFARCMQSPDADTDESRAALKKLASVLDGDTPARLTIAS